MPAESLRQRVARLVDPAEWAKHDRYRATVTQRMGTGVRPWDSYEMDMLHSAAGAVGPSLAKADLILSEILPLLREAGEGLAFYRDEWTTPAIGPLGEPEPSIRLCSDQGKRAAAIHAKIKELIDAEG